MITSDNDSQQAALLAGESGDGDPEAEENPHNRGNIDPTLSRKEKWGYGLGHVLNDLCASMWFTYLLLYFHKILSFDNLYAGIVLFVGQIADGLATPFVGYFSDKGDNFFLCHKYGKRKSWHLIGTACVLLSFPFIFMPSIDASTTDAWAQLFYYCAFVIIFQFGWAATQISHLSMIPDITPCSNERTGLTAIRYGMTVAANITVYVVTWIFLGIGSSEDTIGPKDVSAFRNIMLVSVTLGAMASFAFHILVHPDTTEENRLNGDEELDENGQAIPFRRMKILDWFGEPQFYLVAIVYMSTRLVVNLTQAYIPLYLQVTLQLNAKYVAIIPLVMFIFGLVTSLIMKQVNRIVGRKSTYIIGSLLIGGGCIWIKAGCSMNGNFTHVEIFGIAAFLGSGCSTMLITSLSLTADLIGRNTESGAFVYGAMSLSDKLSNGVAVILIQYFIPSNTDTCIHCRLYFKDILFYVCGGAALLGSVFILTLIPFNMTERWRDRRQGNTEYERIPGSSIPSRHQAQNEVNSNQSISNSQWSE